MTGITHPEGCLCEGCVREEVLRSLPVETITWGFASGADGKIDRVKSTAIPTQERVEHRQSVSGRVVYEDDHVVVVTFSQAPRREYWALPKSMIAAREAGAR